MENNQIYYKYKSLNGDNWKYLLDIILNNRLYCAKYNQLNDPMEGYYLSKENLPQELRNYIRNQKGSYRICSLAQEDSNKLLWAHYADGFKGIVIGLKTKELVNSVNYDGLHELNDLLINPNQDISSLFFHKLNEWRYENESRILLRNRKFINIKVVEIIFGLRVDKNFKKLMISSFGQLNPNIIFKQQNPNFENIEIANQNL